MGRFGVFGCPIGCPICGWWFELSHILGVGVLASHLGLGFGVPFGVGVGILASHLGLGLGFWRPGWGLVRPMLGLGFWRPISG